jgi:hypothetical protein
MGKPVLCCHRRGKAISKMISGNDSPGLEIFDYADVEEALAGVRAFLGSLDGRA